MYEREQRKRKRQQNNNTPPPSKVPRCEEVISDLSEPDEDFLMLSQRRLSRPFPHDSGCLCGPCWCERFIANTFDEAEQLKTLRVKRKEETNSFIQLVAEDWMTKDAARRKTEQIDSDEEEDWLVWSRRLSDSEDSDEEDDELLQEFIDAVWCTN